MRKHQKKFNRDLLTGQKPKKRWHRPHISSKHPFVVLCLILLLVSTLIAKVEIGSFVSSIKLHSSHPWQLKVRHIDQDTSLSEEERQRIEKAFNRIVSSTGDNLELGYLAKTIIQDSIYKKIHIFQHEKRSLTISLSNHLPVMKTLADKMRYVSQDLVIFGDASQSDLPEIEGLALKNRENQNGNNPNELILNEEEKKLMQEALDLKHLVERQNIRISKILLKKYRGFYVLTKHTPTIISFGHQPFTGKIKKLLKILDELSRSSKIASAIELDFEHKAFVKELKL